MGIILTESDRVISVKMLGTMFISINDALLKAAPAIKNRIRGSVLNALKKSDTYDSLLNGDLVGEFGFPRDSKQRLEAIITKIGESLHLYMKKIKIVGNGIEGGYRFVMIESDFTDILSMGESLVVTEKREDLPWLKWLLKSGNSIIFSDYKVKFTNSGRSGQAVMIKSSSTGWRVPTNHAGTITNNWITRAIDLSLDVLEKETAIIMKEELLKVI